MNEIQFPLTTPVKFTYGGEDTDGNFITLKEPTIKQLDHVSVFKTAFYKAAEKVSSDDNGENGVSATGKDKVKVTGGQIMALLYSHYPDMKQLFGVAKTLFFSHGIASVEGVVDFNKVIYDQMSIDDFEKMLGEYLVNFILVSALNQET